MVSKIKQKKFSRTATETNADILERIGGSGGGAYRSLRKSRPDILKLQKQSRPLTTRSDTQKMIAANKASKFQKMNKKKDKKNVAGRSGIVTKAATVGAGAGVAVGYGANQWINQSGPKKK